MSISRLSQKAQTTLPKEVREALQLQAGDYVEFRVSGSQAVLRKVLPVDWARLHLLQGSLSEWNSPEDEAAFSHLQSHQGIFGDDEAA